MELCKWQRRAAIRTANTDITRKGASCIFLFIFLLFFDDFCRDVSWVNGGIRESIGQNCLNAQEKSRLTWCKYDVRTLEQRNTRHQKTFCFLILCIISLNNKNEWQGVLMWSSFSSVHEYKLAFCQVFKDSVIFNAKFIHMYSLWVIWLDFMIGGNPLISKVAAGLVCWLYKECLLSTALPLLFYTDCEADCVASSRRLPSCRYRWCQCHYHCSHTSSF